MPAAVLVALCASAFVTAWVLTLLARTYALRRQLVDMPGERRSHRVATPRGGGIAIVGVVWPVMVWLGLSRDASPVLLAGACGLGLVAVIGWIDDHRPLSPWGRLAVHGLAAGLLAAAAALAGQPFWWAGVVFLLALGLVNVWNFMDGIDGLAATQAILVAIAFAMYWNGSAVVPVACVFAAACAGFLPWNFPSARIFLGDVGSGALGYSVACLIALSPVTRPDDLVLLLLPLSAFLIDATLTLLSRIITGQRWWMPHVQHLYQRCVQAGRTHAAVAAGYAIWTVLSIAVATGIASASRPVIIGAFTTWYLLGAAIWFVLRVRLQRRAPS